MNLGIQLFGCKSKCGCETDTKWWAADEVLRLHFSLPCFAMLVKKIIKWRTNQTNAPKDPTSLCCGANLSCTESVVYCVSLTVALTASATYWTLWVLRPAMLILPFFVM